MSRAVEQTIIRTALKHQGLLSRTEQDFIVRISGMPSNWRLTRRQVVWLYDIARNKLDLQYPTPEPRPVVDHRAKACA